MIELRDIYYTRLGTRDLEAAEAFGTTVLGLQVVERTAERLYLKSDARHHTLAYFLGDPSEQIVAFEIKDWSKLGAAFEQLSKADVPCGMGSAAEAEDRHVDGFMWFQDPTGNRIEIVARPHDSGVRYFPSRDAGIVCFGHVGLCSTDPVRDQAFWLRHFNVMISDWIGPCPLLRVNERHHQMALFATDHKGIQHINFQVREVDDVMRAWYFLQERGTRIVFGPGRHPTSGGNFLYFEGPDEVIFEYSNSDRKIIDDVANYRPRQFPLQPSSFCMWGSKPDIREFRG
ncbi:VOC family protein [Castellaniella defragrans]|uniref:2,3-dihydroxy-p-cumate/2,3-dihydroxybenzoate 3,4-dioxygenase n=1 Tax=Castellaniella defragrans TaxID=75697 RepID=A0A7W9TRA9_CASDE|nr:VOC family protein [Castellaniella defragrans]KAB0620577.1 glyoxalase/bleomycin resistance/extradiol dioxygenase family protein [Castellaniella defragrans]MBB6085404.1 2,3-dihydroxy-p-cumate/2,3-dihydroxybenzoate 3,4-dioxygenase [Castellaniella defragrans]